MPLALESKEDHHAVQVFLGVVAVGGSFYRKKASAYRHNWLSMKKVKVSKEWQQQHKNRLIRRRMSNEISDERCASFYTSSSNASEDC